MSRRRRFLTMALFEGGLSVIAHALGVFSRYSPWPSFRSSLSGILAALVLTGTLLFVFVAIYSRPFGPFRALHKVMQEKAGPLFSDMGVFHFAVIAALAGVGEESVFRGWLQGWAESHWGAVPAMALSAAAFGLAHPLSLAYGLSTALIGLALAALYRYSGGWLAPAFAHGLYDFAALLWFFKKNVKKI